MATYYVRPDGNNTNNGLGSATNQAWATLTKAAQTLVAGDTVYIAPGIYRETLTPSNSGNSSNRIRYIGDPHCVNFVGVTKGAIIISGLNSANDSVIARTNGISCSTRAYIDFINITVENVDTAFNAVGLTNILTNCVAVKGIRNGLTGGGVLTDCVFSCSNTSVYSYDGSTYIGITATRCTFIGRDFYTGASNSGHSTNLYHCIIKANLSAYNSSVTNYQFNMYGCILENYNLNATQLYFGSNTGISCTLMGCVFKGAGQQSELRMGSGGQPCSHNFTIQNCKFDKYTLTRAAQTTGTFTISRCEFSNSYYGFKNDESTSTTVSDSYFANNAYAVGVVSGSTVVTSFCRFFSSILAMMWGTGTHTNNSPVYGEAPDGNTARQGIYVTGVNPISGSKSLRLQGRTYTPPYIQWVPCEANKAKTVKLKAKRNATSAYLPKFVFGNQEVTMTNDTNIQNITLTYTHYQTELVPLLICGQVTTTGTDYFLVDDISA